LSKTKKQNSKHVKKRQKSMTNDEYKSLFAQPVKDLINASILQKKWESSRVQARNRSNRSGDVEYTPFEEIGNQDHDSVRSDHSR